MQIPDPAVGSSEDTGASDEAGLVFQRALELIRAEFEETTWQAFWRVSVEDQYPADVAADLGITTNAVYKAKSRVLHRLRHELGDLIE
jgi:RNA polymerase sigma-70 factor (ECF subfamily)